MSDEYCCQKALLSSMQMYYQKKTVLEYTCDEPIFLVLNIIALINLTGLHFNELQEENAYLMFLSGLSIALYVSSLKNLKHPEGTVQQMKN